MVAEILVHAGSAGQKYLAIIGKSSHFRILPFDLRAAVEVAAMTAKAIASGDKKSGSAAPWQKVKIDRQIIAIGIIEQVMTIYTDDSDIIHLARKAEMTPVSSWELLLPPENPQGAFDI